MKVHVMYRIDGTTRNDRFKGKFITAQLFKSGKAIVSVDNVDHLYRRAETITVNRES